MPEADPLIIQQARELVGCLRLDFPACSPELKIFPSGAFMLHVQVAGEEWVMEYMPSMRSFGVSKVTKATFAWEGFENGFHTFAEAENFLRHLLAK